MSVRNDVPHCFHHPKDTHLDRCARSPILYSSDNDPSQIAEGNNTRHSSGHLDTNRRTRTASEANTPPTQSCLRRNRLSRPDIACRSPRHRSRRRQSISPGRHMKDRSLSHGGDRRCSTRRARRSHRSCPNHRRGCRFAEENSTSPRSFRGIAESPCSWPKMARSGGYRRSLRARHHKRTQPRSGRLMRSKLLNKATQM